MAHCAVSYASDGGVARICQRGSNRGIFLHIRYLYLLLFFFHSFPNEFVSGKHFPFSLSFSLFVRLLNLRGRPPPSPPPPPGYDTGYICDVTTVKFFNIIGLDLKKKNLFMKKKKIPILYTKFSHNIMNLNSDAFTVTPQIVGPSFFFFIFQQIFNRIFSNLLFTSMKIICVHYYYAAVRMVISQLNCQLISMLKRPLIQY